MSKKHFIGSIICRYIWDIEHINFVQKIVEVQDAL